MAICRVHHVLKDGSRPTDITGHIVRVEDVNPLYQLLHSINGKNPRLRKDNVRNGVTV